MLRLSYIFTHNAYTKPKKGVFRLNGNSNNKTTGKQAGNMVRHMIADTERKMAAGIQISSGPAAEDTKLMQNIREENRKGR